MLMEMNAVKAERHRKRERILGSRKNRQTILEKRIPGRPQFLSDYIDYLSLLCLCPNSQSNIPNTQIVRFPTIHPSFF